MAKKTESNLAIKPSKKIYSREIRMTGEKPKHGCLVFERENNTTLKEITLENFDQLACGGQFEIGPFQDCFGDGYGEPYNPNRQVFGKLNNGDFVYANRIN